MNRTNLVFCLLALGLTLPAWAGVEPPRTVSIGSATLKVEPIFKHTDGATDIPVRFTLISGTVDAPLRACFEYRCRTYQEISLDEAGQAVLWLPPDLNAVHLRTRRSRWGPTLGNSIEHNADPRDAVALVGGGSLTTLTFARSDGRPHEGGLQPVMADALIEYPGAVNAFSAVVLAAGFTPADDLRASLQRYIEEGGVVLADAGSLVEVPSAPITQQALLRDWENFSDVAPLVVEHRQSAIGLGHLVTRVGTASPDQDAAALLYVAPEMADPRTRDLGPATAARSSAAAAVAPRAPFAPIFFAALFFAVLGVVVFARFRASPKQLTRVAAAVAGLGLLAGTVGGWWFGRAPVPIEVTVVKAEEGGSLLVGHAIATRPGRHQSGVTLQTPDRRVGRMDVFSSPTSHGVVVKRGASKVRVEGDSEQVVSISWERRTPGELGIKSSRVDGGYRVQIPAGIDFEPRYVIVNADVSHYGQVHGTEVIAERYNTAAIRTSGSREDRAFRAIMGQLDADSVHILGTRDGNIVVWSVAR